MQSHGHSVLWGLYQLLQESVMILSLKIVLYDSGSMFNVSAKLQHVFEVNQIKTIEGKTRISTKAAEVKTSLLLVLSMGSHKNVGSISH